MTVPIPRLVVVLDRAGCQLPWTTVAIEALAAGADQIQIREPEGTPMTVAQMIEELGAKGVDPAQLTVNGYPDVALRWGTNLHLPERMASIQATLARGRIVSRSIHGVPGPTEARYLILGNVLETSSHPGRPGLGSESFRKIASNSTAPILTIGGMTVSTLSPFIAAGAHGVAVRSAVVAARDPGKVTMRIRDEIERWIVL